MKKAIAIVFILLLMVLGMILVMHRAESIAAPPVSTAPAEQTVHTAARTTEPPNPQSPATIPTEAATEASTESPAETTKPDLQTFTEEEEKLLLKLGMAERGDTYCTECIALVMRTVLNRVESPRFSSTIRGVVYAQDQFTPVMDGSFETAQPNPACYDALEMIKEGWDESQGALYYEWCEGESWHSRNLNLLLQHCDTRFYN